MTSEEKRVTGYAGGALPRLPEVLMTDSLVTLSWPAIPPEVQARVERIAKSEILGPLPMPPLPMALLGIAGRDAFLRAPTGQTGLVREGEELGGIKVLRIGTNRVLVQQGDEKKELTLFSGFGSEPLLPKAEKNPQ